MTAERVAEGIGPDWAGPLGPAFAAMLFAGLIGFFWLLVRRKEA